MVSVVIPVYNVAKYLSACLDSIMAQTYKDLDIILVDDGSTDASSEICDKYAALDSRIRVFHKENGGLSDARNFGITKAIGNEITFVDSDDVLNCNMIQVLHSIKHQVNCEMSVCFRRKIDEDGNFIDTKSQPSSLTIAKNKEEAMQVYFETKGGGLVAWGKLYDKKIFDTVRYPVGRYNEDVFTTYKLVAQCTAIAITSQQLYYYRVREGSIMNRPFEKKHLDMIYGSVEMTQFLERNFPKQAIYSQILLIYASLKAFIWMSKSEKIDDEGYKLIVNVLNQYKGLLFSKYISKKASLLSLGILRFPKSIVTTVCKLIKI